MQLKILVLIGLLIVTGFWFNDPPKQNYTVISPAQYSKVVSNSEQEITQLIDKLQPYQQQPDYLNQVIISAAQLFSNRPFNEKGASGEGDWCPSDITRHSCVHIQQDPLYRTDFFDCYTLVQTILALLHAENINDYNKNILSIGYGAAKEPPSSVHYYNRNNFISTDFNPINQANGLLKDVTDEGVFAQYVKNNSLIIDPQAWFNNLAKPDNLSQTVRVLHAKDGPVMALRLMNYYMLPHKNFFPTKNTVNYIPKDILAKKIIAADGTVSFQANQTLIDQLPTPSVIEVVRDTRQWKTDYHGAKVNIKKATGTENNISHVGLIYHQHFKKNELIYPKINCYDTDDETICRVTPVFCHKATGCLITMFAQATSIYPDDYYFYQDSHAQYHCTADTPPTGTHFTTCNRVISMPLGDYLTVHRNNRYFFMHNPSVLGIHLEKIMDVNPGAHFH